jgi:hypothetical protein
MHYALTIWTAHFFLKKSDYKNYPNHGHLPCHFHHQGSNPGPYSHQPTMASIPVALLKLPGLEPMQHLAQLPTRESLST